MPYDQVIDGNVPCAKWTFPYTAAQVLQAAEQQRRVQGERIAFWEEELTRITAELKATGIEFREMPHTGYVQMEVVADQAMMRRRNDCITKLAQHKLSERRYWAFVQGLSRMDPEAEMALTADDIRYFFEPEEEDDGTA